jgi:hypothetical protein
VKREDDGSFTTSVYRKPTHSERYLHFSSNHPLQQKLSAVHSLKYRALHYCSRFPLLEAELLHLKDTFVMNGFRALLLDNILFCNKVSHTSFLTPSEKNDLDPDKIGCLVVPYIAEIHRQLVSLCKREGVHLLYCRQTNLGNLIAPTRPKQPMAFTRSCVYEIPCKGCEATYIGETKRMLQTRCKEHAYSCLKAVQRGQVESSESFDTGLPTHVINTRHEFDFDGAKVLKTEENCLKRKFLEALEIMKSPYATNLNSGKQLDQNWLPIIQMFCTHSAVT